MKLSSSMYVLCQFISMMQLRIVRHTKCCIEICLNCGFRKSSRIRSLYKPEVFTSERILICTWHLIREAAFTRERMSGDKFEVQFAHVTSQLRSGELSLVKILKAGVANRIGALDARVTLNSRLHCDVFGFRFGRASR